MLQQTCQRRCARRIHAQSIGETLECSELHRGESFRAPGSIRITGNKLHVFVHATAQTSECRIARMPRQALSQFLYLHLDAQTTLFQTIPKGCPASFSVAHGPYLVNLPFESFCLELKVPKDPHDTASRTQTCVFSSNPKGYST